ncbi:MAG: hypothetical protein AAF518_23665 [Spirochaetota bacterium]
MESINLKPLFKNFLEDKLVYSRNQKYWSKIISLLDKDLVKEEFVYLDTYGNGTRLLDGNPIYSVYFPKLQRSIRIIQEKVEDGSESQVDSWTKETEIQDTPVEELVISLELTRKTSREAFGLMKDWV